MDPAAQLAQQVLQALADGSAQPMAEVQDRAAGDGEGLSELEMSLGEWGFGYGVAWALVRAADPMMSSNAVADLARRGTALAWRMYSEESWGRLLEQSRGVRPEPPAEPAQEGDPDQPPPDSALSDFMGKVAQTRSGRQERGPRAPEK
jgi:hypothetical protein